MASDDGSKGPRPDLIELELAGETTWHTPPVTDGLKSALLGLGAEEQDRIADGEPYCFRCGKPASSFSEYELQADEYGAASNYVVREEGTYNPETNRFACDACYIAIGMPSSHNGWRAP